jgi:hypothetical protein
MGSDAMDVLLDLAGGGYLALSASGRATRLSVSRVPDGTYALPGDGRLIVRDGAVATLVPPSPRTAVYKPSP